jgi:hypothetical protein
METLLPLTNLRRTKHLTPYSASVNIKEPAIFCKKVRLEQFSRFSDNIRSGSSTEQLLQSLGLPTCGAEGRLNFNPRLYWILSEASDPVI